MLTLGPLAFLSPWLLAPLAGLPVLWWLLRLTPPAPRRLSFPALRLLLNLTAEEQVPRQAPWWILLLRLVLVSCLLVALAHPVLHPQQASDTPTGPLVMVIDDGWASGPLWQNWQARWREVMDQAARHNRPVYLLFTAQGAAPPGAPLTAADALQILITHAPHPWAVDRAAAAAALTSATPGEVLYFSDGVDTPESARLLEALAARSEKATLVRPAAGQLPLLLLPAVREADGLKITLRRAGRLGDETVTLRAISPDGRVLARQPVSLPVGQIDTEVTLVLPAGMVSAITRLEVENSRNVAAVQLVDTHWRRRPVGLVGGANADRPLLGSLFYLRKALEAETDLHTGTLDDLLNKQMSVIILADMSGLSSDQQARLRAWMQGGGVLVRFAGPALAAQPDELLPVHLRQGERNLGGALSWAEPQTLRSFTPNTPLAGLPIPLDVRITRQVLAQPEPDLSSKTWLTLNDGTPLVTAQSQDKGWLVLVHTTANADWSNLPLSGLYVEMLKRFVLLSSGIGAKEAAAPLPPVLLLDGFARFVEPSASVEPLVPESPTASPIASGPTHPPGFYGRASLRQALNLITLPAPHLTALPKARGAVIDQELDSTAAPPSGEMDLRAPLLALALALLALDLLIVQKLRGLLSLAGAMLIVLVIAPPSHAADSPTSTPPAVNDTWLAYIQTGDSATDSASDAGLRGLAQALKARTSVRPAGIAGLDIEHDDVSPYPFLYWPVTNAQPALSAAARARLNTYLQQGGLILFDTQDGSEGTSPNANLQRLTSGLNLPALAPVSPEHVLTRSFYLLHGFSGRLTEGQLWAEATPAGSNDSVSSILVGSNDWAGAWQSGQSPTLAGTSRVREQALRAGINMVMYALTGNYKSDQIHVSTLLERLGQ